MGERLIELQELKFKPLMLEPRVRLRLNQANVYSWDRAT